MVEELIERMFAIRNAAHIEHWKTESFSQHDALGDYYESVIPILDKFVEANMGGFGVIGDIKGQESDITSKIREDMVWLTKHREEIAKNVPALENILDELTGLHLTTLFKLDRLR